jgi:hypothetical protein
MIKCNNCGHDSHCGTPLRKEQRDGDNKLIEIEVCKCCRCAQCDSTLKTDWS